MHHSAQTLSQLLLKHRSIRKFKPDALDPQLVESVLQEAIAGTSSSGNLNGFSVILTRDPARKDKLCELHQHQAFIKQAPLLLTFCADTHRTRQWLALREARDNFNNFKGFLVAAFDTLLLAQSAALGFEAHGLGLCYLGTTLDACDEIADFLQLPETCIPVTSYVVGVPDENPAKRDRLPLAAYLHEERYQPPGDATLLDYFREREIKGWQRYQAMGEAMMNRMQAHGIESLAQFYTSELKYPPDDYLEKSRRLRQLLDDKGFGTGLDG